MLFGSLCATEGPGCVSGPAKRVREKASYPQQLKFLSLPPPLRGTALRFAHTQLDSSRKSVAKKAARFLQKHEL